VTWCCIQNTFTSRGYRESYTPCFPCVCGHAASQAAGDAADDASSALVRFMRTLEGMTPVDQLLSLRREAAAQMGVEGKEEYWVALTMKVRGLTDSLKFRILAANDPHQVTWCCIQEQ
jgi:hypothetical protein